MALLSDLLEIIHDDIVYTICARSRSNMSGTVRCFCVDDTAAIREITLPVARAAGLRMSRDGSAIRVSGCGFDRGQAVVEALQLRARAVLCDPTFMLGHVRL